MSQTPPEAGGGSDAPSPVEQDTQQSQDQQPNQQDQASEAEQSDEQSADLKPGVPEAQPGQSPPAQGNHAPEDTPPQRVVVRYGLMRRLGLFRHNLDSAPAIGDKLVVRTERGVELGQTVSNVGNHTCYGCVEQEHLKRYLKASGEESTMRNEGKVLRRANAQDVIDHRHLAGSAREEAAFCREQIRQLGLDMKLVSVEHLLGGERIMFNFSAEARVDFRELVRHLAKEYRTRIEMRQVGARDEARLLADYERCGQRCCCQQFIKELKPISMRMAKVQKATLDPSKISGRCGRLMCCLRFEDSTYEQLRSTLPKKNTWVLTDDHIGRVVETQILAQLVRIELPDNTKIVIGLDQIRQRDLPQPSKEEADKLLAKTRADAIAARQAEAARQAVAARAPAGQAAGPPAEAKPDGQAQAKKKTRRRRRRRGTSEAQASAAAAKPTEQTPAKAAASQSTPQAKKDTKPKRRRRRRKRSKKPAS